ncbi:MAG: glycosyltransferase family 2 protein [Planctomycetaceae bacterium]
MLLLLNTVVLLGSLAFACLLRQLATPLLCLLSSSGQAAGDGRSGEHAFQPTAVVILCVRGADPTLSLCVQGLLNQKYQHYALHIIMDSYDDPGAKVVRDTVGRETCGASSVPISLHYLNDPHPSRGLKVSAILQVLNALDEQPEVVAFADADTQPARSWLSSLVQPLQNDDVGATCGTRWFHPQGTRIGSLVRMNWNLFAVSLMLRHSLAWGGAMALHRRAFDQTGLVEHWQQALCEDACLRDVLTNAGLEVQYVAEVAMVNSEDASIKSVWRFIRRQFVHLRLDCKAWPYIAVTGLLMTMLPLLATVLFAMSLLQQDQTMIWLSGAAMSVVVIAVAGYELPVRKLALQAGQGDAWRFSLKTILASRIAILLSTIITALAIMHACVVRRVLWRGIAYRILNDSSVQMDDYRPMLTTESDSKMRPGNVSV